MADNPDQIRDVMAREKNRGKRSRHSETRRRKLSKLFAELLERGTEENSSKLCATWGCRLIHRSIGMPSRSGARTADLSDRAPECLKTRGGFVRKKRN